MIGDNHRDKDDETDNDGERNMLHGGGCCTSLTMDDIDIDVSAVSHQRIEMEVSLSFRSSPLRLWNFPPSILSVLKTPKTDVVGKMSK